MPCPFVLSGDFAFERAAECFNWRTAASVGASKRVEASTQRVAVLWIEGGPWKGDPIYGEREGINPQFTLALLPISTTAIFLKGIGPAIAVLYSGQGSLKS